MPQIFQVLRCYKCFVFQVHQAKKSNKWQCKLCGEKQSVKRHYGLGTAKECRLHVQKLNCIRGEINVLKESRSGDTDDEFDDESLQVPKANLSPKKSKWTNFVDQIEDTKEILPEEPMYLGDKQVVLEISKKRKKSSFKCPLRKKMTTDIDEMLNTNQSVDVYVSPKDLKTSYEDNCTEKIDIIKEPLHPEISIVQSGSKVECKNMLLELQEDKTKAPVKPFIPPVVNSNSKWSQFVEEEEDSPLEVNDTLIASDIECSPETKNKCSSEISNKCHNLFSLCTDGDLDSVLDI